MTNPTTDTPNPGPVAVPEKVIEAGEDAWYQLDHRLGHNANGEYDRAVLQDDLSTLYLAMHSVAQQRTQYAQPCDAHEYIENWCPDCGHFPAVAQQAQTTVSSDDVERDCPLGDLHGCASTFADKDGVRCCDFCGHAITTLTSSNDGPRPWSETMGHDPAAEMARKLHEGDEGSRSAVERVVEILWSMADTDGSPGDMLRCAERIVAALATQPASDTALREALEKIEKIIGEGIEQASWEEANAKLHEAHGIVCALLRARTALETKQGLADALKVGTGAAMNTLASECRERDEEITVLRKALEQAECDLLNISDGCGYRYTHEAIRKVVVDAIKRVRTALETKQGEKL